MRFVAITASARSLPVLMSCTTGRTVIDTRFRNHQEPNCHVAFGADQEKFCDFLETTLALGPQTR